MSKTKPKPKTTPKANGHSALQNRIVGYGMVEAKRVL